MFHWCYLLLAVWGLSLTAEDWPQWRGPQRDGSTTDQGWQDRWPSDGPPVAWKAKVGLGMSSIVVAKGRAFTLGHAEEQDRVVCFDAESGRELWRHAYPADLGDKFFDGGTTGSPTTDADRVYTLSRWGDVFCLESETGKVVWSKNLQTEFSVRIPDWGFGGSPLVVDRLLLLNVGESGMALDKSSGALVWKSVDKTAGYSSPLPWTARNGVALVSSGQSYAAIETSTGKELWRIRWLTQYGVNAADPIVSGTQVFLSTGYGKGAALLDVSSTEPREIWKSKVLRTQMNPAVLLDGYLYGVDGDTTETAALKCVELATGTEKWAQPGFGSGAVILADGKLIGLNGTGELFIAPASPSGFAPSARAQVLGGKTWTAPSLANGRVYCRNTRGDVVCLDLRKK